MARKIEKVNIQHKLSQFHDHWNPRIVGELNGQQVKLVKFQGEFVWHHHENEDELFLVVKGRFRMDFRDRQVWLEEGELLIVPRGIEHRPVAGRRGSCLAVRACVHTEYGKRHGRAHGARARSHLSHGGVPSMRLSSVACSARCSRAADPRSQAMIGAHAVRKIARPPATRKGMGICVRHKIDDLVRKELTEHWYPHAVNRERGGFHQSMARDWSLRPDENAFLVYQARMTWTAAAFARYSPAASR